MADQDDYATQIAQMRAERHQREAIERVREIEADYGNIVEQRDAAEDPQDWAYLDQEAERLEAEYARLVPQEPQSPFTEVEQDYLRKHSMSDLTRPHWSGIKSADGKTPLSTWDALVGGSGYAQQKLGLDRNSPAYREALEVLGPIEKTGVPSADDIVKTLQKTSKYGKDLKAKDYNKGVERLWREKAKGGYPDR